MNVIPKIQEKSSLYTFKFITAPPNVSNQEHADTLMSIIISNFFYNLREKPLKIYISFLMSDILYFSNLKFSLDNCIKVFVNEMLQENKLNNDMKTEYLNICTYFYSFLIGETTNKSKYMKNNEVIIFNDITDLINNIKYTTYNCILESDGHVLNIFLPKLKAKFLEYTKHGMSNLITDKCNRNITTFFIYQYINCFKVNEIIKIRNPSEYIDKIKQNLDIILHNFIDNIDNDYFEAIFNNDGASIHDQYNIIFYIMHKIVQLDKAFTFFKNNQTGWFVCLKIRRCYTDLLHYIDKKVYDQGIKQNVPLSIFLSQSIINDKFAPIISLLKKEHTNTLQKCYFDVYDVPNRNDINDYFAQNINNYSIDVDLF